MNSVDQVGMLALLVTLLFGGQSNACSCGPQHPQTAFCHSDIVIKGKIIQREQVTTGNANEGSEWIRYEIKQTKMFKGFEKATDVQYLYTPHDGGLCGFEPTDDVLDNQKELVIAGMMGEDGRVSVSVCSFIQPWANLTSSQKRGIMFTYKNHCNCKISPCQFVPCALSSEQECLWTDGLFTRSWDHVQAQQYACVKQDNGVCGWAPQKPTGLRGVFTSNQ
ncbi:metalloproteinase inhibitor 4-like [Polypterus senegalus]|uniref:metalloproteinase inhibitor 4-like n=1 Tax=Polypterus senegalus TaxID=55291 RepID=UPI0019652C21|nr:metalloproteinase inhibitor 4-like [Polypterus senegalus]